MQQRVTAILVARSGAEYLHRTLAAIDAQTVRPDFFIGVDASSADESAALLASSGAAQLVTAPAKSTFGQGVAAALHVAPSPVAGSDNEWLWLLAHDNAPEPTALAQLFAAVEIAPSVSVAGPKLMRWHQADVIAEFGESMTDFGTSVRLVDGELDQAQHDVQNDVLGVAAAGMLVRRSVWTALGGFDPGLPSTDAALDFSIRARLAGHRVVVVPGARVASAGGPQHFGRTSTSIARRTRISRAAQLHRRLVYAPAFALPLHWVALVPLAIIRSIVHLLAKRPGAVAGELVTAFATAFSGMAVGRARRNLRRTKTVGWRAIAPLRLSWRQAREQRSNRYVGGESSSEPTVYADEPVGFISGGGLWAVVSAGIVGLVAFGALIGATSAVGGGLLPLAHRVSALWANVGYGWRDIGAGFTGAADPFAAVLAFGGTLFFWNPSTAVVVFYVFALPLAAVGAFFSARHFTVSTWIPALAALLWAVSPPLLGSLDTGHLGAAVAHVLLPWFVLLLARGGLSWASGAGAALLFAVIGASAPVLVPALLIIWIAALAAHPTSAHRLLGVPIPAAALFAPLVIDQLIRGTPLGLLADPGVPTPAGTDSAAQLALGSAEGGSLGWTDVLIGLALPGPAAPIVVAALLLPLAALAVLGLFVRGPRRAIPPLGLALLGYATAVLASRVEVASIGAAPVGVWAGSGLSLFWLGLLGAAIVALDAIGRVGRGGAVLLGVASVLVCVPLIAATLLGTTVVRPGPDRLLPAFVDAEATSRAGVGTLVITPAGDEAISATLQRGRGTLLDDQSTLDATATSLSEADVRLANLAGNLASRSGYDSAVDLDDLAIGFVVLAEPTGDASDAVFTRTREALDGNALFVPVGETTNGLLWRYSGSGDAVGSTGPSNTGTPLGLIVLGGQGLVFALTVLLAIPTSLPRRRAPVRGRETEEPATTFDEDTDD
ncbi:MAG: glycosyltransferase [Burkholderiaceae bacterium]|nr:glycosyltransferase [Microbacteriaceae bacterium]